MTLISGRLSGDAKVPLRPKETRTRVSPAYQRRGLHTVDNALHDASSIGIALDVSGSPSNTIPDRLDINK